MFHEIYDRECMYCGAYKQMRWKMCLFSKEYLLWTRREEREEKSGKVKLSVWYLTCRVVCCFFAQVQCCLYYLATLVEEVHTYQMRKGGRIQGFYIFQVWSQGAPTANRESQFFARPFKDGISPLIGDPSKKSIRNRQSCVRYYLIQQIVNSRYLLES